jgi:hypothetical protein
VLGFLFHFQRQRSSVKPSLRIPKPKKVSMMQFGSQSTHHRHHLCKALLAQIISLRAERRKNEASEEF